MAKSKKQATPEFDPRYFESDGTPKLTAFEVWQLGEWVRAEDAYNLVTAEVPQ